MFQQNGLSLDQAPPIGVIFRLFFVASLFGVLSGIFILLYGVDIFDLSSIGAITIVHTLTLGVMASFMLGALFQMLPVIGGVVISAPVGWSWTIQILFVFGLISLLLAFNLPQFSYLFIYASILLGLSLLGAIVLMGNRLLLVAHHTSSSRGMLFALVAFGVTIFLAIYLSLSLAGVVDGIYYMQIKVAHYSFGLFGWITLLIFSISFQVIEMFYVTPPYPSLVGKYLPLTLFVILIFSIFMPFIGGIMMSILLISFSLLTLYRLSQKKRPLADATIWFWRLGLTSLIVSMLFAIAYKIFSLDWINSISSVAFVSFALSIIFAMFYKIVPFLTWFHLNAQGYYKAPMMHEVIHPKTAKKHFWIHSIVIISLLLSIWITPLIYLAGASTILSFGWVSYQVIYAHLLYVKTQKSGEKFDMSGMD